MMILIKAYIPHLVNLALATSHCSYVLFIVISLVLSFYTFYCIYDFLTGDSTRSVQENKDREIYIRASQSNVWRSRINALKLEKAKG
jgi:Kef-type K+ transport system membrane component KefB